MRSSMFTRKCAICLRTLLRGIPSEEAIVRLPVVGLVTLVVSYEVGTEAPLRLEIAPVAVQGIGIVEVPGVEGVTEKSDRTQPR